MRYPEIQASVSALRNTRGLPWPKGYKKKAHEDILDWLKEIFGFQKDNVANQREHLILLLANVHIRQFPNPDQQPKGTSQNDGSVLSIGSAMPLSTPFDTSFCSSVDKVNMPIQGTPSMPMKLVSSHHSVCSGGRSRANDTYELPIKNPLPIGEGSISVSNKRRHILSEAVNKSQQRGASRYCAKNAHELLIKDSIPVVEDSITIRNKRSLCFVGMGSSARRLNIDAASQENNNYTYHDMQEAYIKRRCKMMASVVEVDRLLRPEGKLIVRDNNVETIYEVEKAL
ncbi:callose synthase 2-like protein, partial [Tanacetum coccineum]